MLQPAPRLATSTVLTPAADSLGRSAFPARGRLLASAVGLAAGPTSAPSSDLAVAGAAGDGASAGAAGAAGAGGAAHGLAVSGDGGGLHFAGDVAVAVELTGRMAVVTLRGTLDVVSSHEVSSALDPLLDAGLALVVLDVGHAEFADTSGLGVLLRAQGLLGGSGTLVLRSPRPSLLRLLQLTGLCDEFQLT